MTIKILAVIALALILAASISTACAPSQPTEPTFHPEIIETRYADGVRCYSLRYGDGAISCVVVK